MKISIVMPLLNDEYYVRAAIESILAQTYELWDLTIIDGGSTDASLDIVNEYVDKDSRVSLFSEPGTSIYEAIFSGISRTDGEIISWLNTDDLYVPWALDTTIFWMNRPHVEWLMGLPSIWDPNGRLRCVFPHNFKSQWLIKLGVFHPGFLGAVQAESTFFKRTLFQSLSKEDMSSILSLKLAGDFALWRAFARHTKLTLVPSVLGGFRVQGRNASIEKFDLYMDEVKSTKVICLPRRIASLVSKIFNYMSVMLMHNQSVRENRTLNQSLGLD